VTLRVDPEGRWQFARGERWFTFRDPDGPPSPHQLRWLAARGLLEIRREPAPPLSKLDCARAIDQAREVEEAA
jgi:hypothetical protein